MSVRRRIVYLVFIAAAVLAILVLLIVWANRADTGTENIAASAALSLPEEPDERVIKIVRETVVTEERKTFDTTILEESLNDMGILITEEYAFTEVATFSSVKTLFNIQIGFTESGYMESYDGSVTAGIDFSAIKIRADDDKKILTVTLPKAEIQTVTIDPDSFKLYSEKEGWGNHISAEDFNGSLVELKANAEKKALEKGVLERADENAENIVANFIRSLPETEEYAVQFARAD